MKSASSTTSPAPRTPRLRKLAEEIRLQLHLAGMEAKDAWKQLEPRLHEYEQKLEGARDKISDELHQLGETLDEELTKLHDRIKR